MKVVLKSNGVVVTIGIDVYLVENGIFVDNVIYGEQGLHVVETELEVLPFKNTLIDGVVGINPFWTVSEQAIKEMAQDDIVAELFL